MLGQKCLVSSSPASTQHNLSSVLIELISSSVPFERTVQGACVCIGLCAACQEQEPDQVCLSVCLFLVPAAVQANEPA